MQQLVLILHVLTCLCLLALILVQQGRGADIGASFGAGASNTVFGSAGATPFLMKITGALAAIFFVTSISLSYMASHQPKVSHVLQLPSTSKTMPATDAHKK